MNVKLGPEYLDNDTILIKFLFHQSSFEGQTGTNLSCVPRKKRHKLFRCYSWVSSITRYHDKCNGREFKHNIQTPGSRTWIWTGTILQRQCWTVWKRNGIFSGLIRHLFWKMNYLWKIYKQARAELSAMENWPNVSWEETGFGDVRAHQNCFLNISKYIFKNDTVVVCTNNRLSNYFWVTVGEVLCKK